MSAAHPPHRLGIDAVLGLSLLGAFVVAPATAAGRQPAGPPQARRQPPPLDRRPPAPASSPRPPEPRSSTRRSRCPEEFRIALFDGRLGGHPRLLRRPGRRMGSTGRPSATSTRRSSSPPTTRYEVYALLREMVGLLDDPFTNFYSPDDLGDPEVGRPELRRHRRARRRERGRRGRRGPAHRLRLRGRIRRSEAGIGRPRPHRRA